MDNYISERIMSLDEYVEEANTLRNNHPKNKLSTRKRHWVYLIRNKMLECVATGKEVAYCSLDYIQQKNFKTYHYNFYSEEGELFTIDHKVPTSKGGSRGRVDNIQPMLQVPNSEKGNDLIYL